jgi:alkanesulfonate monooxygenase SsuD/methylene tetrahydromethanopterin reductase-like flavin-dependent oxidoreductase (luciferase family)
MMRISLFCEMQGGLENGVPNARATFDETLEQAELADKVGFSTFWLSEHHFTPGFALSSQPMMMLSAIAARTKQIRLGCGVVVLPYHHPVHVAERIAYLDLLSHGRVEFGTGRGGVYEQTGMGVDPVKTREMWRESLDCVRSIWQAYPENFEWEGKHWKVPPRVVVPQPIQNTPKVWLASLQDESLMIAGELGLGVLAFMPNPPSANKEPLARYRSQIAKRVAEGQEVNNNWAAFVFSACADDGKVARQTADNAIRGFFAPGRPYAAAAALVAQKLAESWGDNLPEDLRVHVSRYNPSGTGLGVAAVEGAEAIWNRVDPDTLAELGVTVAGNPEQCIAGLMLHEALGVDEIMLLVQAEGVSHAQSMETIRLIGEKVIPVFHNK